ncbi:MAG: hypothetical protein KIS67_04135 [Verrucomicrobiae bacterium]|nr:hypothetical protein [Verrucomicrobiae bacterium]
MKTELFNSRRRWLAWVGAFGLALNLLASEQPSLDPNLEPLRPWLGKTWKGEFKNSTPDKPIVDVSRWERALNGKAVRVLHSVNDGAYGGESIVMWDEEKKTVAYHYFTTAGFRTAGTMTFKDGKVHSHETVTGNAGGITEVRSTAEVRPDGTLYTKTEYFKNGEWTPGREVTYREDSTASVIFK